MPMPSSVRIATTADAAQIAAIYAPSVVSAVTSFEFEPPTPAEMARRITETLAMHPWLVVDRDGQVMGYARAGPFKDRLAYQWSVEMSVYVHADARRAGVARALYRALIEALVLQGFYRAYIGVTLPNPASVAFHEGMGFTPVGVYRAAGFKMGAWHDVGWWQRSLQPLATDPPPRPPRPLAAIVSTTAYQRALASGTPELRL
jgi:L-amino acid N-acyltransferase YncA